MRKRLCSSIVCILVVVLSSVASGAEPETVASRRVYDAAVRLNKLRARLAAGPAVALPDEAFTAKAFAVSTDVNPGRFNELQPAFEKAHASDPKDTFVTVQRAQLGRYVVMELDRLGVELNRALQTRAASQTVEINPVERALGPLELYIESWIAFKGYAANFGEDPFVIYTLDPTCSYRILPGGANGQNEELSYYDWGNPDMGLANPQILPHSWPVPGLPSRKLEAFGCRGQYIPLSFAVQAGEALPGLRFETTELHDGTKIIPAEAVDLRVVKAWWRPYMGSSKDKKNGLNLFTNEMLLHDDGFVQAQPDEQINHFKETKFPNDLPKLTPVGIPAGLSRQFWVTIHLPKDAQPGCYMGKIKGQSENGHSFVLDVSIEVLPFDLEATPFAYTAFHPCHLVDDEELKEQGISISYESGKTRQQMQMEFINMAEHGMNTLILYDGKPSKTNDGWDFSRLGEILEMAKKAGLTRSPFVWAAYGQPLLPVPNSPDRPKTIQEVVENLQRFVQAVNAYCDSNGYPRPALYGQDEVAGERLTRLRESYAAITDSGGLVAQACYGNFFDEISTALSLPIVYQGAMTETNKKSIRAAQAAGYECWIYNTPATDMPGSPSVFRRRYGLAMWRNGENGAAPWAYSNFQEAVLGNEDCRPYREHVHGRMYTFVLPTWDGKPIDTVIYEAFREGIYDTRYMATLEKYIQQAKQKGLAPELVAHIDKWLASFSVNDDLQLVRRQMADFILALSQQIE